jgi:hypothetical protein
MENCNLRDYEYPGQVLACFHFRPIEISYPCLKAIEFVQSLLLYLWISFLGVFWNALGNWKYERSCLM